MHNHRRHPRHARGRWLGYPLWQVYLLHGVLLVPLCLIFLTSFCVTPEEIESGRVALGPGCLFLRIFGAPCPFCGMSRAFCAISHGNFAQALRYNSGSLWLYAAAAAAALAALYSLLQTMLLPSTRMTDE